MRSMTIKETILQMKKGVLTAEELCLRCQRKQLETKDLNIFISETDQYAIKIEAQQASEKYQQGTPRPLEGIPIAFKDNFCTRGLATTCGSRMLHNYVPPYNATMVTRVLDNGGISVGKTNMDEFAMGSGNLDSCFGAAKNPWNRLVKPEKEESTASNYEKEEEDWFVAGGSSGGSAAAVASGTCLGAFGSDTGGSVRIPSSYCGIVGLKPTYGLLSRHGLISLVNSLDVPGIMARTVEDVVTILNAVAGYDENDSTTVSEPHGPFVIDHHLDLSNVHIGIPKEYHCRGLSPEVLQLWKDTADNLERAGAQVSEVSLPHSQFCILCYKVLCCCEVASNFSRYDGIEYGLRDGCEESTEQLYAESRHKGFNDVVRGRILNGNFFLLKRNYERFFMKAQQVRRLISNDFHDVFHERKVDLLLTPMTLTEAPLHSEFALEDNQTRSEEQDVLSTPANMAGVPSVSLPLKLSSQGLPLSLQLIGPRWGEGRLLSLAHWLECQAQFPHLDLGALRHTAVSS